MSSPLWYRQLREYLKKIETGPSPHDEAWKIMAERAEEAYADLKRRREEAKKDSPVTRREGFAFGLIKLLKKKPETLTRKQINDLKLAKIKAEERALDCYEKFSGQITSGKGIEVVQEGDEDEQTVIFERLKKAIKARKAFDAWLASKDSTKSTQRKPLPEKNRKECMMEVVEAKKKEMYDKMREEMKEMLISRQCQPPLNDPKLVKQDMCVLCLRENDGNVKTVFIIFL